MAGKPQRRVSPSISQDPPLLDEALTPNVRERLAQLAIASECYTRMSDLLASSSKTLILAGKESPQFAGRANGLRDSVEQLHELFGKLAKDVMHHSHVLEDVVVAARATGQEWIMPPRTAQT